VNTPAHAIINLLVLSHKPDHRRTAVIFAGAVLPDLAIPESGLLLGPCSSRRMDRSGRICHCAGGGALDVLALGAVETLGRGCDRGLPAVLGLRFYGLDLKWPAPRHHLRS
jgi:hypothetical protein